MAFEFSSAPNCRILGQGSMVKGAYKTWDNSIDSTGREGSLASFDNRRQSCTSNSAFSLFLYFYKLLPINKAVVSRCFLDS